jgi:hypothetical protein
MLTKVNIKTVVAINIKIGLGPNDYGHKIIDVINDKKRGAHKTKKSNNILLIQ